MPQFGLRFLFWLTLVCASSVAGWLYLDVGGAFLALNGVLYLGLGIRQTRRVVQGKEKQPRVGLAAGIMCFAISVLAFGILAYCLCYFYGEFGYGWWRTLHPSLYGE